jgi:hypothetical protein
MTCPPSFPRGLWSLLWRATLPCRPHHQFTTNPLRPPPTTADRRGRHFHEIQRLRVPAVGAGSPSELLIIPWS